MSNDIDPKILAESLMGDDAAIPTPSGLRKLCVDKSKCGLGSVCEHAQSRGKTVNVGSFWTSRKTGDCDNYFPRTELGSVGDVPRRIAGQSRHNAHAPPRATERERLARGKDKATPSGLILPPHLQQPPDLGVKRHIRHGRDINKDED